MKTGEIIKRIRESKNITQQELAEAVGYKTASAINKIELGLRDVNQSKIVELAKALGTTPEVLIGWSPDDSISIPTGFMPAPKFVARRRLGAISCGEPLDTPENFEGYDYIPENYPCDFTLRCEGDSMIGARIQDGDIVFIKQQPIVESGQIAAVLVDGTEKLLKRVYIKPDSIILQAENPKYEPLFFVKEDMNRVKIIGRAVGFMTLL